MLTCHNKYMGNLANRAELTDLSDYFLTDGREISKVKR